MIDELNIENRIEIDRSEAEKYEFIHQSCVFSLLFSNLIIKHVDIFICHGCAHSEKVTAIIFQKKNYLIEKAPRLSHANIFFLQSTRT